MTLQRQLAPEVIRVGKPAGVRLVAGLDVAVGGRFGQRPGRAAVVVLSYPELQTIEQSVLEKRVAFPYVPGLLSFREIPVLLPALEQMRARPDLIVVDGQGIAHPRRLGLAAHLGLLLDLPTIGCAKSRLTGTHDALGEARGSVTRLMDGDEVIGALVRTKDRVKPVYVSVGHRIDLDEAVAWILRLTRGYRLPEPTRLADRAAGGLVVAGR